MPKLMTKKEALPDDFASRSATLFLLFIKADKGVLYKIEITFAD